MTKTQAVREIMQRASKPISLMEIQKLMYECHGLTCTDGTISRRLREFGAKHRNEKGINRYWIPASEQERLFDEGQFDRI